MSHRFSAVHQFHSGTAPGDAITNQMFALQAELQAMGINSDIFAEHIDQDVSHSVRHIDSLVTSPHELLLVHHSMGHRRLNQIVSLLNPIITVYHNITPAQELDDPSFRHFAHVGRHQLDVLAKRSLMGIADSHYNRKEMLLRGFGSVEVVPVRTDFREFESARESRNPERDWLFVGRIAPNKQQVEIIRAFNHYHHNVDKAARLFLIGDHKMRTYVETVGEEIERLGLVSQIDAPGKLDDIGLISRYARAGVFVSLSRHEGFGVPLLEAMAAGVPVVALKSSAVTETMGGAGILLESSEPQEVSNAVERVMNDPGYREDIIWRQDQRLRKITSFNTREALSRILDQIGGRVHRTRVQVQGPIETSYSLAILNRETALQLDHHTNFEVSVSATEGPGDYRADLEAIEGIDGLKTLFERGLKTPYPDVVIRQMFPPRVHDSTASVTLQYFGWEESVVPAEYVKDFNQYVNRIMTMSSYVRDILRDSGVTIPIDVAGVGVREPIPNPDFVIEELTDLRGTRFLHISSAFPRKGVDVLLEAYFSEFSGADDTTLILKSFPNPHNSVAEQLKELTSHHPNPPHVVWINRDLPVEALGNLYAAATAYAHPARGEGFGLPVAEAMLAGIPVVSTDTSGLADFVSQETAAVIPSTPVQANSHVSVPGSIWFEPDLGALKQELRAICEGTESIQRQERAARAHELISRDFSWEAVGGRVLKSVEAALSEPTSIKVAHLTTFNSRCGIAEYSGLLQSHLPHYVQSSVIADRNVFPLDIGVEEDITRLWDQIRHQDIEPLTTSLLLSDANVIHLQYNYGFFSMEDLSLLIEKLHGAKPIVITLHRTKDLDRGHEIVSLSHAANALRKVSAIIVHEEHDISRLAEFGISGNVVHVPHAAMPFSGVRSSRGFAPGDKLRIGTFGFLLPHKGLETTLESVDALNRLGYPTELRALCSLHPDPSSSATHQRVMRLIESLKIENKVRLDTEYKSVEQIHTELSDVDVVVLPYSQTEESSSGVLAMLLGIGKPIIATDLDIFAGAASSVRSIPSPARSEDLTAAIIDLISDPQKMLEIGNRARQRSVEISWGAIGRRTADLYQQVLQS